MRTGRILPGIGVLNGRVFVVGGEFDSEILANGEVYDPHEDTWAPIASMSIPRYFRSHYSFSNVENIYFETY